MRALLLACDDAHFNFAEAVFFQKLVQLHFTEAEPVVRVQFASPFEAMVQKIEDDQPSAAFQKAMCRRDGALRMNGVMQRLAQNRKIDTVVCDRRIFNVAKPVFEIFEAVFFCELGPELDHLRRIINCDNLASVFRKQLRKGPFARAQIGYGKRWQQGDESVGQRLP